MPRRVIPLLENDEFKNRISSIITKIEGMKKINTVSS
jgi:hypothetical protein